MPASEARKRKRADQSITKKADLSGIQERLEKKAKRAEELASTPPSPKPKTSKPKKSKPPKETTAETTTDAETVEGKAVEETAEAEAEGAESTTKHRFIVFIGNLPFDCFGIGGGFGGGFFRRF